jgi:SAM-dependent methyltransferase
MSAVFEQFMENGAYLFNAARLAPTEEEHCNIYYEFVGPRPGAVIVDLGCGVGEVGAWFQKFDPTLQVVNVVNDEELIKRMLELDRGCILNSMDETDLPDSYADNVMFNESIGHVPLEAAFKEAARLLRTGGVLTIKDFSPVNPATSRLHLDQWGYTIHQTEDFIREATKVGFSVQALIHPPMFTKHWYDIMDKSEVARESAMRHNPETLPICMVLYRFVKGELNGRSLDRS